MTGPDRRGGEERSVETGDALTEPWTSTVAGEEEEEEGGEERGKPRTDGEGEGWRRTAEMELSRSTYISAGGLLIILKQTAALHSGSV